MESVKTEFGCLIRLETGEEIHESISRFMKEHKIMGGAINAIGALSEYSLGYYDLGNKEYIRLDCDDEVELVSCLGNLAYKGSEPVAHLHAVVSKPDMSVLGGHLFRGVVSATCELTVFDAEIEISRLDVTEGLPLLNLRQQA